MKNIIKICLCLGVMSISLFSEDNSVTVVTQTTSEVYTSITITSNHKYLVAGNAVGSIELWDYKNGKKLRTSKVGANPIFNLFVVNGNKDVVFTTLYKKPKYHDKIQRWNINKSKIVQELKIDKKDSSHSNSFSLSGEFSLLGLYFSKQHKPIFGLWDYKKNKVIQTFILHEDEEIVNSKLLVQKQQVLTLIEYEKGNQYYSVLRLYDIKSGKIIREFARQKNSNSLGYVPMVISLQENKLFLKINSNMTLWNISNGEKISKIKNEYEVQIESDCLFSNDEKSILLKKIKYTNNGVKMTLCTIDIKNAKEIDKLKLNTPLYSWTNVPNTNKIMLAGMNGFEEIEVGE